MSLSMESGTSIPLRAVDQSCRFEIHSALEFPRSVIRRYPLRFPRFLISKPLSGAAVLLFVSAMTALAASADFSPQTRLGYMAGDQWEPAIAADGYGDIYLLYPQYGEAPDCASCSQPAMMLEVSNDNGASWQAPRELRPSPSGQFDAQIVVDPLDRRTIYASWLQNGRTEVVFARSRDFGSTWSIVVAATANSELDKPVLAVRGRDVYVGFNHGQKLWVSSSHDGGSSFTSTNVNPNARRGWALAGGATVDPHVVLVGGLAAMTASGVSMAGGAYLATKSQREIYEDQLARFFQPRRMLEAVDRRIGREYLEGNPADSIEQFQGG